MVALTRRELLAPWKIEPRPPKTPQQLLLPFLRPPGAADEASFLRSCERCDKCAQACEYNAIRPLSPAYAEAANTPALLPSSEGCRLCEGLPCAAACPTAALSVVPRTEVKMGTATLDEARCWSMQGQPCDYCISACPLGPEVLWLEGRRPTIDPDRCTGCGMCEYFCTQTPRAITIVPRR